MPLAGTQRSFRKTAVAILLLGRSCLAGREGSFKKKERRWESSLKGWNLSTVLAPWVPAACGGFHTEPLRTMGAGSRQGPFRRTEGLCWFAAHSGPQEAESTVVSGPCGCSLFLLAPHLSVVWKAKELLEENRSVSSANSCRMFELLEPQFPVTGLV